MEHRFITVIYKRMPNKLSRIRQLLLWEGSNEILSLGVLKPSKPITHGGHVLIDEGYLGMWLVEEGVWHDVAAIYDRLGSLVGYYSDIATPIKRFTGGYEMTDLFLDLWVYQNGSYLVLDRDEFDEALRRGILEASVAQRGESELRDLINLVETGRYPPETLRRFIETSSDIPKLAAALR
ncbi:MAG: DUF402 domain-containing protein [Aigarchaeota archaeon]|nr:DUF402 domain-containing protein [Aigarchaeota archaeon]